MVFQFKQITLDTVQYQLYLSGKPISVEPQVFDLLVYLIENRDRVVGRDELLENLWKGKVVTDAALGVCLKDARKAIGDSGTKQAIIKTFHGRGYQFIAEVSESTPSQPLEKNEAMATSGILELPVKPSIAVLPFSNLSNDAQQECLADGMTNEIITGLSKVPGLFVIANHSMMVYKDRTIDIKEVGREQGVRYVLEGSIRVVGNQIRVTAQLIDATTGLHLWAEGYQRELDDIFTVQDEITHNIVVELQVKLITGEYSRLETRTNSVKAWELVIRSRPLIDSHVRDDAMAAKQLLERALELDNNYCAAWTMLGWVYWEESVWEWSAEPKKSMQIAFEATQKALSVNADYPECYSLLGNIHMVRGDTKQAVSMNEKAVELAPSDSLVLACLGNVLIDSGRFKEGIQKMQRAIRLCPFSPAWYLMVLGAGLHLDGDSEAAISALEQAIDRGPDAYLPRWWLTSALVEVGRLDEARAASNSALDIEPTFDVASWVNSFNPKSHGRIKDNLIAAGLLE